MTDLAKNIKRLRQAQSMTQDQLAQQLQTTRETVISWERADTTPSVDQLPSIAEALGTDVVTLLYPVSEPEKEPFRPGCGFVFGSVFLYFFLITFTGQWGLILGPVAFLAICTAVILEAIHSK